MLYKFKSKATGDLIMLEPNGRQVLQIIGKDAGPKGIIQPAEMGAAASALEAAIAQEEADEAADPDKQVSLRQRAVPFLEMLRRAGKAGEDIVWGV
jgi:cyclopropane-fatty-acyl-phospholipid synthase